MNKSVQIVNKINGTFAQTFDVTGKSEHNIQKLIDGIERKLNHDVYIVLETTDEDKYDQQ